MDLMTKDEVLAFAFSRTINLKKIPDSLINSVQEKHIRPILGDDFYEAVIAVPTSYTALTPYLEPIIAYFVKYYILPDILIEMSDTGINQIAGQNRQVADSNALELMRQAAIETAQIRISTLNKYLYDNQTLYPLYYHTANPSYSVEIVAGIIFEKDRSQSEWELSQGLRRSGSDDY